MEPLSQATAIALTWDPAFHPPGGRLSGSFSLSQGEIAHIEVVSGDVRLEGQRFSFSSGAPTRLHLVISGARLGWGAHATRLTVENSFQGFSFLVRDVQSACPVFLPEFGVAITLAQDGRSYAEIARDLRHRRGLTRLQQIESQPEESLEAAAAVVRRQPNCPTWLGLSRDMRSFLVNFRQDGEVWDWIQPQLHSTPVALPEYDHKPVRYNFFAGRGVGCVQGLRRWLEEGSLPLLHAAWEDGDIDYHVSAFCSLESGTLLDANGAARLRGTHYLVADAFGYGNMQTEAQALERQQLLAQETERPEETVLYLRLEATNRAAAPRYAWFKSPAPNAFHVGTTLLVPYTFDAGCASYAAAGPGQERVFLVARLNCAPMPQEEMALLLQPGETVVCDIFLPHRPISQARAAALAAQDFDQRQAEVRRFWRAKLAQAAQVSLPEKTIQEMFRAGLLHLDLVAYGLEPQGVVAPCIGVYCPIGSESAPIVQFFDAMGLPLLAQRSLEYFIAKQHADGFIQNFGGYMLETGAALWSLGEHYRCTGDEQWVRRIEPNILKACEYLLRWSERNRRPELVDAGYGMLEGKVGDPEDPYHIFMLNGYAYLGLARSAEMLEKIHPEKAREILAQAQTLKGYIRKAIEYCAVHSPVVPLGDGTWIPALPPWAEYHGPVSLYADGGNWFTHGAFNARDSLVGPLYLLLQEVVERQEPLAGWLLTAHAELMTERNAAFSQPYYSPHPWVHLQRGEVKPFLKAYYNTAAALADRQTYTFWEHFQLISPHKVHEEGWFLMQTRWMLYLEEGNTLRLMPGIPRRWLADGQRIAIDGMASYFGRLKVSICSQVAQGRMTAALEVAGGGRPLERVRLRLPHPEGRAPRRCLDGAGRALQWDAQQEALIIEPWNGSVEITLEYE